MPASSTASYRPFNYFEGKNQEQQGLFSPGSFSHSPHAGAIRVSVLYNPILNAHQADPECFQYFYSILQPFVDVKSSCVCQLYDEI